MALPKLRGQAKLELRRSNAREAEAGGEAN
jgi:hypothetical protein